MRYYIADLHNGDETVFKLRRNLFNTLQDMCDTIVKNWNSVVKEDDEVFLLGDIGCPDILIPLKGKITIILGNHDINIVDDIKMLRPDIEISKYPIMLGYLMLSHEPFGYLPTESVICNIHGHTHDISYLNNGSKLWDDGNRYFCCSVEQTNYTPISEKEICDILGYKANTYRKIVPSCSTKKDSDEKIKVGGIKLRDGD